MSSFIIDALLKLSGAQKFQQELQKTQNQAESASSWMSKSFNRLAKTIVGAFSVKAIVGFTQTLVSAAAQVNASNAQFAATFKEVGDSATKMFNDVSKATGVMNTRLRVAGTKAFSQFKGAGLDANRALSETERYLNLAADAAAYYDISLEDADMRLRSFIRGNVEAGDMIGLFTSETQRNSKALELYGQKYITLTEAQKQMTMLNIADEIYRQSGALGQASRESGEYANQTGNLAESWLQLKAVLGTPILESLVPVIQELSGMLSSLATWLIENNEVLDALIRTISIAAVSVGSFYAAMLTLKILETVKTWVSNLTVAIHGLNAAVKANWIGLAVTALTSLIAVITTAKTDTEKLADATDNLTRAHENYKKANATLKTDVENLTGAEKTLYETRLKLYQLDIRESIRALADTYKESKEEIEALQSKAGIDQRRVDAYTFVYENQGNPEVIEETINHLSETLSKMNRNDSGYSSLNAYYKQMEDLYYLLADGKFDSAQNEYIELMDAAADSARNAAKENEALKTSIVTAAQAVNDGIDVTWLKEVDSELYDEIIKTAGRIKDDAPAVLSEAGKESGEAFADNLTSSIQKTMESMRGDLEAVTNLAAIYSELGVSFDETEEKAEILKDAFISLAEAGLGLDSSEMKELISEYEKLGIDYHDILNPKELTSEWSLEDFNSEIDKALSVADSKSLALGNSFDAVSEKIRICRDGIEELIEQGYSSDSEEVMNLQSQLEELEGQLPETTRSFRSVMSEISEVVSSIANDIFGNFVELFSAISDLQNQELKNEISILEARYEKQKELNEQSIKDKKTALDEENEALKDQLYSGQISYAEYLKEIEDNEKELTDYKEKLDDEEAASEEELQKKKDELGKKQFEANKASQIAQVWIQAATAVVTALAQLGPIAGAIAGAAVMATAGVQTATISKQQYTPALAEGGIVDEPTHALIGEDGAEAVVPLKNNTEWVGGLAKALSPAIVEAEKNTSGNSGSVREEIVTFRQMVAEFFDFLRSGNREVVIDGQVVARVISPYVDVEMGRNSRLRARGI